MTANLAENTNQGELTAGGSSSGNGKTWREIDRWVEELATLASSDASPELFYSALLGKSLAALAASGGAVWRLPASGIPILLAKANLPQTLSSSSNLRARWQSAIDSAETIAIADGRTDGPLLVSAVPDADAETTIIEMVLPRDWPQDAIAGSVRLMEVFREVAAEFNRRHELAGLRRRGADLRQFEELILRVHDNLDLPATADAIANDGRLWIGCDRLTVVRVDQRQARALAVSGSDQVDPRGAAVSSLERLASAVAATAEPLVWPQASQADLAPQLTNALQGHLDVGHARQLIALPIRRRSSRGADNGEPIRGALIAESFDERLDPEQFHKRTHDVARHGGAALLAALAHHDLPFLPLQVKAGRLLGVLRRRRAMALAVVGGLVVLATLLALVPADFSIEARGTLQPQVRRHLFAPADGVVESVLAEHGASVERGQPLLQLRDPRVDLEFSRVIGELQTAQARLAAVQAQRSSRNTAEGARNDARQLAAEEEQLKEQVRGLEAQQALLTRLRGELRVTSPIDGVVLTWNTSDTLLDRPVKQGQRLVTVADPSGPWVLELKTPDADMGHLLVAQRRRGADLPVSFLLATDPAVTHTGRVERVAMATDLAGGDSPSAETTVKIDGPLPAEARAGTSVTARVHCGLKPIGYVWLHDLIDAIRTQILF
jgi:multidrug efflux pump subunit AcrA (membrane-fusion protein)